MKDISPTKDKQAMQEKYMEFQAMQQQLNNIQKYNEELQAKVFEFHQAKESINQLKDVKKGTELLVPAAQGIFIKSALQDTDELIVNIGANTAVGKTIPQVIELLDSQIKEIENIQLQIDESAVSITERLNQLLQEIKQNS